MSKHKTREQKRKADERKRMSFQETAGETVHPTYTFSAASPILSSKTTTIKSDSLLLVKHDLKKTAFVSLGIVALQLIFYFLLRNHVLAIGFVRY